MIRTVKMAAVKWVRPRLASITYTARRGLIKGMRRRGGFSFVPSSHLSSEEKFLMRLSLRGQTVFDVGGWEGVYTMFFARAVGPTGKVVTFEPNPANRRQITQNVALNGLENVTLRPTALGDRAGSGTLVVEGGIAGEGHVRTGGDAAPADGNRGGASVIHVDLQTLDAEVATHALPVPSLVKLDVEGFEVNVLRGMTETIARARPAIFVEVHQVPDRPTNSAEVIDLLLQQGYTLQHMESGREVRDAAFALAHSDHLYCEIARR
jgi:FkbM family methyltransferase